MPGRIGIVARTDRDEALELAVRIAVYLESKGLEVLLEPTLASYAGRIDESTPLEDMESDLIITIGGDGTILRTCLRIPKPEPPILAVDMGVRGFLTEVQPRDAITAIDRYLEGDYKIERCSKLASYVGGKRLPDALNEVFITSRTLAKLLHVNIWKDGVFVTGCRSDGVIVASQVGSTGYSLSGGGPILDPDVDAFVLTPVCPLTVIRPIVFSMDSILTVKLVRPESATVVIDGQHQVNIGRDEPGIVIKRSEYETSFVRFSENFYHRLKTRLLFYKGEETA